MRREAPEPWATAMRDRGMLHGTRPSFSKLASEARPHTRGGTLTTQAVIDITTGKTQDPADDIVRALATALALPVEEVARWIGRPLEVGTPYVPPNGADRLSRKQRDALDHIIRVMIEREERGFGDNAAATKQAGESPANVKSGPWPEKEKAPPIPFDVAADVDHNPTRPPEDQSDPRAEG